MKKERQPYLRQLADFVRTVLADAARTIRGWSLKRWLQAALLVGIVVAVVACVDVPDLSTLRAWAARFDPWFPVVFWLAYVTLTLFPLPRTIWTVAAGILFGPVEGLLLALTALSVSAAISFLVVRRLLGDWMRPRLVHPAVFKLNAHLERRGWFAIASLRMVAGVPFSILNYAAALTPVPFLQFLLATALGSIPTTAMGVFFGETLTTGPNPWVITATVVLTAVGIAGLVLDAKVARELP
ncbi:TVP38/TMEM64 family protein [Corynebacterium phoceense]|uniref:TVP38/TMEM64 family protein n=1 Tax=Corynebacterium phoceense TaxID=1686286 RepID=UPI00211BB6B0|nr:TVP38/TMEM64 family protein [Corynebacterium phoceense]